MAKIAVLLGPEFEDSELTQPLQKLKEAGHEPEILGVEAGQTLEGKRGDAKMETQAAVKDRPPEDYDAILIPGGHAPDRLRMDKYMVSFVKRFNDLERPIAAVCHGPQLLIEADVVKGRRMTSWPSVRTDLMNAGATVVDEEVCVDGHFITSRKPDDLEAFSRTLVEHLS